jgi:CheY-like chemotaxis protein
MDGVELAGALRRLRPDLPLVVSSGLLDDEARRRLSALGGLVLLEKPYTLDELADALARAQEAVGSLTTPTPPRP